MFDLSGLLLRNDYERQVIEKLQRRFPEIISINSSSVMNIVGDWRVYVTCSYRGQMHAFIVAISYSDAMAKFEDSSFMLNRFVELVEGRIAFIRETIDPWCRWRFSTRIGRRKEAA